MSLVEAPRLVDRNPQHVHLVERHAERPDGALEDRGVGDVELVMLLVHQTAGLTCFGPALLGEVDVGPPGEPVLLVPRALAVTQQDEPKHANSVSPRLRRSPRRAVVSPRGRRSGRLTRALPRCEAAGCIWLSDRCGSPSRS